VAAPAPSPRKAGLALYLERLIVLDSCARRATRAAPIENSSPAVGSGTAEPLEAIGSEIERVEAERLLTRLAVADVSSAASPSGRSHCPAISNAGVQPPVDTTTFELPEDDENEQVPPTSGTARASRSRGARRRNIQAFYTRRHGGWRMADGSCARNPL